MELNAPWKIVYNTDDMYEPDEDDIKHRYITSIEDTKGGTVLFTDSGYHKPNPDYARLIAAAPDLLQALKACVDDGFLAGEVLDQVSAAIAKAEGS